MIILRTKNNQKFSVKNITDEIKRVQEIINQETSGTDTEIEVESKLQERVMSSNNGERNSSYINKINVEARKPQKHIAPITKASGVVFDRTKNPAVYEGPQNLAVERQGSKKQIDTVISLNFDETIRMGVTICTSYNEKVLTPFDRAVHDAITTQYIDGGNQVISTNMIYQVMIGNKGKASDKGLSPHMREAINRSIDKMFHSYIVIDASQEAEAYGFQEFKYQGHLLPCSIISAKINGQLTTCIRLSETPPLYEYANRNGQIARTDLKILNVPLDNSPENIELRDYLLRQIQIMSYNKKFSRIIRYDTLYLYLGINDETIPSKDRLIHKRKEIRNKVKICLEAWKQEGIIKGFTEEKESKTIAKVKIEI